MENNTQQLLDELERLKKENLAMQERLSIIESASELFFSLYIIDLENDAYSVVHATEFLRESFKNLSKPQDALNYMIEFMILDDDKSEMIAFNDLSTLRKRLRMKAYISQDYKGLTSGWARAYIMPALWNKEGEITKVMYATHQIHHEKELERTVERLEQEIAELKARLGE